MGWYLQNEQGFEGSHDGTRQLALAAGFAGAAAVCLVWGWLKPGSPRTLPEVFAGLVVQIGLSALAVYLVDQSQQPTQDTLQTYGAMALLAAVVAACGLRWKRGATRAGAR